jgi:hypothetical protein
MKASELAKRLLATPDAEVSLRTNGYTGALTEMEFEIEAIALPVKGHEIEIQLKPRY